jgi:hypothetical protein
LLWRRVRATNEATEEYVSGSSWIHVILDRPENIDLTRETISLCPC